MRSRKEFYRKLVRQQHAKLVNACCAIITNSPNPDLHWLKHRSGKAFAAGNCFAALLPKREIVEENGGKRV
jgi:hypothetical protein